MRLVLDEHISPAVATGLRRLGIDAVSLQGWSGGAGLGASDGDLLAAAFADGRVLVSYDRRTIEPLLKDWAVRGLHHAGVVLIDERTVRPNDVGGLIRSIQALATHDVDHEWEDRVVFVRGA